MKNRTLLSLGLILGIIVADQLIKHGVMTHMELHERIEVTPWFHLFYTENQGMAFGMTFVGTWILALFRIVAISVFAWYLAQCVRRLKPLGYIICLSMIIAGAVGNIIDNMFLGTEFLNGRVVDMFYFPLFQWPEYVPLVGGNVFFGAVFNFADASISCGAVALLLFYSRQLTRENA